MKPGRRFQDHEESADDPVRKKNVCSTDNEDDGRIINVVPVRPVSLPTHPDVSPV